MTTLLQLSRQPSERDDVSDRGFQFSHPLFATSQTPPRAALNATSQCIPVTTSDIGSCTNSDQAIFATTPSNATYAFQRQPSTRTGPLTKEELPHETPCHLISKTSASAPRRRRAGRIGLGPPKRAERQSLEPEEDLQQQGEDSNASKENRPPSTSPDVKAEHLMTKPNAHASSSPPRHLARSLEAVQLGIKQLRQVTFAESQYHSPEAHEALCALPDQSNHPVAPKSQRPYFIRTTSDSLPIAYTDAPQVLIRDNVTEQDQQTHSTQTSSDNHDPRTTCTKSANSKIGESGASLAETPVAGLLPLQLSIKPTLTKVPESHDPPPKLSLDGSLSTATRKAKTLGRIVLNGREYIKLDQIGKGGSSKVYRVMAPTGRIFALKRVDFEQADQATIQGYKSEIDLLGRLSASGNCDRIIRLYDSEISDHKGRLLMLMEAGEIDLAHMLTKRASTIPDFNFIRLFWRHMLEAVQAVHAQKIVHSDLKPANFLLVEGSLKLIDFGIAKAIGNDTTNIHRDSQVGTINYMSPEAFSDTGSNGARVMKLGRGSDVWSLGCILYQMVYGRTPFSHLTMIQKFQAIPNPAHRIDFPLTAYPPSTINDKVKDDSLGRTVDGDLLRVLRGCLERDQKLRLTIEQLLADPFLRPEDKGPRLRHEDSVSINLAQLTQLLRLTVSQTREKTLQREEISSEDVDHLAKDFLERLRWTH